MMAGVGARMRAAVAGLWTRGFAAGWMASLALVVAFDLLWCYETTFRGLGFAGTYVNAVALATVLALPSLWHRRWAQMGVLLVMAVVMMANLIYCRTYFNSIPAHSYLLAGNVADFTASIWDTVRVRDFLLPAIALAVPLAMGPRRKVTKVNGGGYLIVLLIVTCISCVTAMLSGGLRGHVERLRQECYYTTTPAVIYTIPGAVAAELLETQSEITPERRRLVDTWLADHERFLSRLAPGHEGGARRVSRLVLIICESLESWPIGLKVEGQEVAPNMSRLVADTAVWYAPRVLSQVGNGHSIDGQLLMLAGMYPMQNYVYAMRFADNAYHAIPQAFAGGETWLLSGDKPATWNQGRIAAAFGIDSLRMERDWDSSEMIGRPARLSDRALARQAIARFESGEVLAEGRDGYVQVVTYSGHNPFRIPDEYKTIRLTGDYPPKMADYLTAVSFTDSAIGELVDYLRGRPDADSTAIVIVGDHEGLAAYRQAMLEHPAGRGVVAAQGYVPLIVVGSGQSGVYEPVMGQADVYSTLREMLGLGLRYPGMGFPASARLGFAFNYQGELAGDTVGVDPALVRHVASAPAVSDIIIRHNLLPEMHN